MKHIYYIAVILALLGCEHKPKEQGNSVLIPIEKFESNMFISFDKLDSFAFSVWSNGYFHGIDNANNARDLGNHMAKSQWIKDSIEFTMIMKPITHRK